MEDVKIRVNGKKLDTECYCPKYATDTVNTWKNEIWKAYDGLKNLIYFKNKTWRNCWVKFGLISPPTTDESPDPYNFGNHLYINHKDKPYQQYQFPTITDIQDYVENGGSLAHAMKQAVNRRELAEELYKCHSNIDWNWYNSLHSGLRDYNFLGSQWYTHAWNSKGVDLGDIGWNRPWVFNIDARKGGNKLDDGQNPNIIRGYGLSFNYAFAGSDLLDMTFKFHGNSAINNAQGMFKALQTNPSIKVQDENGNTIVSTRFKGFAPLVMTEMFKQAWETREVPNCIYYDNCHSISGFVFDAWNLHTIRPYSDCRVGEERLGNILTIAYPDNRQDWPANTRNNWRAFGNAGSLRSIGPLLNLRYCLETSLFEGSGNIQEVYIKNLNGTDKTVWNFTHLTKLKKECVKYLIDNLWDRPAKFNSSSRGSINDYLVHTDPAEGEHTWPTINIPQVWLEHFSEDESGLAIRLEQKGWRLRIDGREPAVYRTISTDDPI